MGNLYDFHDLEPRGEPNASFLMPEALTYNGHCLDQEIPRFYTMSTDGRNNFERELNAPAKVGDGNYYLSSRIKERTISVNFFYDGDENNNKQYIADMDKLKSILSVPNVKISFQDDKYYFVGTADLDVTEGGLKVEGKITLTLADPYAHYDVPAISGAGNSATISDGENLMFKRTLKMIKFTPSGSQPNFSITDSTSSLKVTTGITASNEMIFDFENLKFTIGGTNEVGYIALNSNFGDFQIKAGETLNFSTAGDYEIDYEVLKL